MSEPKGLFETLLELENADLDDTAPEQRIWDRFGQTCAVLVLDSTGFSRTTQQRGIVYFLSLVAKMREIGGRIFSGCGATGFRAEADNLFAEFPTADQALTAAFEMHCQLEESGLMLLESEPFTVCIGIGYGRLLLSRTEGMFGDEMNLASKLGEDTATGGQTLLTEAAYSALQSKDHLTATRQMITIAGVALPYFEVAPDKQQVP